MHRKKIKTKTARVLAAALAVLLAVLVAAPVLAAETEAQAGTLIGDVRAVTVRVESNAPGNTATVLPRTDVLLLDSAAFTAYAALEQAMAGDVEAETGEYGAFITAIGGVSDETGQCSWMYAVNNELAAVSADAYELAGGEEIVFYFVDWQVGSYAFFDRSAAEVAVGEPLTLTLTGLGFDGSFPVSDAAVIALTEDGYPAALDAENGGVSVTDEAGAMAAPLVFPEAGTYTVIAEKLNADGVPEISSPLCVVTVTDGTEAAGPAEDAAEAPAPAEEAPSEEAPTEDAPADEPEPADGAAEPAPAAPSPEQQAAVTPNASVVITDTSVTLTGAAAPVLQDGAQYLPVRAIAEALGATVAWDEATRTGTVSYLSYSFSLNLAESDVPVTIINHSMYVPADYLLELLNMSGVEIITE